jgi:hypothetical protein
VDNWIFVTGAPGSMWSGVSQKIREEHNADMTDCTPDRTYTHHKYAGHKGNYYGPKMQYGNWLGSTFGTRQMWIDEIDKSFNGPKDQTKVILSHNFAYYLNDIVELFPKSKIIAVVRDNDECFRWWQEAGGWNITYPNYEWYKDDIRMMHEISQQNNLLKLFTNTSNYDIIYV